jgi:hypothetical protein
VQRLRYFDGEYLRSYDFTDEQSYHIAMRRLMNLRLHLHGIVFGLGIEMDQDSVLPNGPLFFSVAPGMAIDKSGREIVVKAPYSLTEVLTGPGLRPGWYEVWICYQENETGLPAAGYLDCDVQNQNTRFQEAFQIVLNPQGAVAPNCGGVRLGTIDLRKGILGLEISKSNSDGRTYVGIRAQRIIAPDEEKDQFDITAVNTPVPDQPLPGYLDVHPGVFNRGNVIVKKNQVIGDDFVLDSKTYNNLPNTIPPTGNLKVTSDLFLNGSFYGFINGQWYGLQQYIQMLTPAVITGNATIPITAPGAVPAPPYVTGTVTVNVNSNLPAVTKPLAILVALTEVDWVDPVTLEKDWFTSADPGAKKPLTVSVAGPSVPPAPAPSINLTLSATVGPVVLDASSVVQIPITSVSVSYVVVFTP